MFNTVNRLLNTIALNEKTIAALEEQLEISIKQSETLLGIIENHDCFIGETE